RTSRFAFLGLEQQKSDFWKRFGEPISQRLHAWLLGGVMPCFDEREPRFRSGRSLVMTNLSGEQRIAPRGFRRHPVMASCAADHSEPRNFSLFRSEQPDGGAQGFRCEFSYFVQGHPFGQVSCSADFC